MPIVFVHGVANRDGPDYRARLQQRDALFRKLVLPATALIEDPYWGDKAVTFQKNMPWIPLPDQNERFGSQDPQTTERSISQTAHRDPALAIDAAYAAALQQRTTPLTQEELDSFAAAVTYLARGADREAFDPTANDAQFLQALSSELSAHTQTDSQETFSWSDRTIGWLRDGLSCIASPITHGLSDAALLLTRRTLSEQIALFIGDALVYLRWRDTQGPKGTAQTIFKPIVDSLIKAAQQRSATDPLLVVGHSLGGVILYDILNDPEQCALLQQGINAPFQIDALVTVGSQVGVFADMGLYPITPKQGRYPKPPAAQVWFNVFDYTDVLSYSGESLFEGVEDFKFNSMASLFGAHSSYFLRPSFYSRLKIRLRERGILR